MGPIAKIYQRRPAQFRVLFVGKSNYQLHTKLLVPIGQNLQCVEPNEQARLPSSVAKGRLIEDQDLSCDVAQPPASIRDNVERSDTRPFQSKLFLLGEEPILYCVEHVAKR
jgi:hypothetical protein